MKKSLLVLSSFLLAFLLVPITAPMTASAQSRIEHEIQQLGFKSVGFKIAASVKPRDAAPNSPELFDVDMPQADIMFEPTLDLDTDVTIDGWIKNLTGSPLSMGFIREQTLPKFWKSSVCFGQNCYADFVSATVASEPWKAQERRELILHIRTPPGATGTGTIDLTLYSPGSEDSVDVRFTITALPVPPSECRTFWFENPYAGDVVLKNYSIADPQLFDITLTSDTEYPTYEDGIFTVQFCSKVADGLEHSTVISFETDSGTFQETVTLQAPASSVKPVQTAEGIQIVSVSPNPASLSKSIAVNLRSSRSANITLSIVDLLGRELHSINATTLAGASSVKLDADKLPIGSYIVLIKQNGQVIDQTGFNVAR